MNNNNLLIILAGAAVLYWLSQKGQIAVTTAPAITATGATVPATVPQGRAVSEIYGGGGGENLSEAKLLSYKDIVLGTSDWYLGGANSFITPTHTPTYSEQYPLPPGVIRV